MIGNREAVGEYRIAMRALAAGEEMPPDAAARIERELRRAFVEYQATSLATTSPSRERTRWLWRVAGAAALVLTSFGVEIWRESRVVTEHHVTSAAVPPAAIAAVPAVTAAAPPAPAPPVDASGQRAAHAAARPKRPAAPVLRPAGFVPLPEAAGLPPFESGSIVRVDVPIASLPGYGIDISPASDSQPVEADVLVGQDGQARAIRLVTHSSRSSQ